VVALPIRVSIGDVRISDSSRRHDCRGIAAFCQHRHRNRKHRNDRIERLTDPNERRIVRTGLTAKGTQVAEALISEVQENLIGPVDYLGKEDSKTLICLISKAIAFFTAQFED